MKKYILRLDDACERRNRKNWERMEKLLDKNDIRPVVGIIPKCEDPLMEQYEYDENFWDRVEQWQRKGWTIALHGFNHLYISESGGMNPVNNRSEFAGVSYEEQERKITEGLKIFNSHGINPKVFFAPSHTFDENTLKALKHVSEVEIISDTIAYDAYWKYGFTFVPQQSGKVRKLPFKVVTFCYHPDMMTEKDFDELSAFLEKNGHLFTNILNCKSKRKENLFDRLLRKLYFIKRGHW